MKKNLRNILALSLALMTTVSFAQDWNVDSRTRIDMSGDNDKMDGQQRATLGATWGGSDWGIHISSDVNYTLGGDAASMGIYEAYASTDLMGFASVTAGRQAINNGSGALMSGNDWGASRTTWDGMSFGLNLDMANITVGYHSQNAGMAAYTTAGSDAYAGGDSTGFAINQETGLVEMTYSAATDAVAGTDVAASENTGNLWINASGEFSGWNVNVLYMTRTESDDAATGIDISGEVMGAGVSASMNTDFAGNDMRVIGLSYAVNDDMGVNVSQTTYSDEGAFNMAGTNMDGSWMTTGGMGYLNKGDEDLAFGLTYNMAGISMGATMHKVTNTLDEAYERAVTEINLGYALGDNAALGVRYATDEDDKYTWLTLTVTP